MRLDVLLLTLWAVRVDWVLVLILILSINEDPECLDSATLWFELYNVLANFSDGVSDS